MAKQQKNKDSSPIPKRDYEQLGRSIEAIITTGYFNRARYYRMAFVRGIFQGVGTIIGATLVITVLLWILSLFEAIPLVGPVFENVQDTIDAEPEAL